MKKLLTLFLSLCMMASMVVIPAQVSFAQEGFVLDFDSAFSVATDKTHPRIEADSYLSYFFPLCTKSQEGVEECVTIDGENKVFSLGDASSNANLGSLRVIASIANGKIDYYTYKVKKVTASGSYTVAYQEATKYSGEYEPCTSIPLFTMDASGNVLNGSGVVTGSYNVGEWYTVVITKAQDSTNLWNVILVDNAGNTINASTISNGNPTILSSSKRSVLVMANLGSEVYVDDLSSVNSGAEFVFDAPDNVYEFESTLESELSEDVTIDNVGTSLGGYDFANSGTSTVTLSPYTDESGKSSAKISVVSSTKTDNTTAEIKIPACENVNKVPYSLKFRFGVDTLTSELGIRMLLYKGSTRKLPYLLSFGVDGEIRIYGDSTDSDKYNANRVISEIKWQKGALYDFELIYDMEGVYMLYITDTDGTTYGYDISEAMNQKPYTAYSVAGFMVRFRGWSDGAIYLGDAVQSFYTAGGEFDSSVPANGAEMVALDSEIKLNYTDYIDASSVTEGTVTLKDENSNVISCNAVVRGKSIVVTSSELEKGKSYTVSASEIKNLYGDIIEASGEICFETARALTVTDIKLNNSVDGTAIKGNNIVSANVYAGDDDYDLTLIVAAYDKESGALIKCNAEPYVVAKGEAGKDITTTLDLSDINASDWCVRVFVWKDLKSMIPLMSDVCFEN